MPLYMSRDSQGEGNRTFTVTAWNNGSSGYGLRVRRQDRRFFQRNWRTVTVALPDGLGVITANLTDTFWKYRPAFPVRFGSIQDARAHRQVFFPWYNTEHHHAGLGLLTPADVHHGLAEQRAAARAVVLATAYAVHPERFPAGPPHPPACPTEVWINPPIRPRASANAQPSHLRPRRRSPSLSSITARS